MASKSDCKHKQHLFLHLHLHLHFEKINATSENSSQLLLKIISISKQYDHFLAKYLVMNYICIDSGTDIILSLLYTDLSHSLLGFQQTLFYLYL